MMAKKRNAEGLKERTKLVKQRRSKQNHERLSKKRNAELEDQTDIVPEADDDFQKSSKKCRTKEPVKRPTKEFVEYSHTKLKLRCSPFEFMNSIQKFTEAQKSEVKNMGFGAILTMNIDSVATGLGYWLLMNYDEETNTVNVGNHKINITASKVQEVFGIPMGKIQVLEKNKPRKGSHSTIDEFKNQFDTSRISVGKILPLIEQLQDGGRLFKLNFLVVWNTVFGEITKSTTVNQRFLLAIEDESEIPEMDWCSYMIDCLRRTKESWRGYNDQYNGPIALLAVLYTHEYNKRHKPQDPIRKPALSYITSESLDDMETFLFNNGPLIDDEVEEENIQLNKGPKEGLKERTKLVKGRRSKQKHDRLSKKMNAEIEDQMAIAPESDVDCQKPSKKARTKEPVKRPTKEFIPYRHTKLKMRCSPFEFISSIQKFTEAQKSEVKNMGFGAILKMNIDSVATGLGYWLLINYDEETNTVNVGNRKIKITASKVHEVFGIPMGKIQVLEKNRPRKGAHSTIDEFKNQFDTSRISVGKILPLIEQLQDGGRLFKLNFLVVWNTIFGEITKSTTVNQRFLLAIEDESEIPEMDWCSYMIDCLKRTKESWRGYNDQYNGPIALLSVLYTHEYNKRHKPQDSIKEPAISYITSESLDDMETFLFNNGPLTDDEVEEENIQSTMGTKGNDDQHANKSISTEKQDKEIQTEIDSEMNNDNVDGDYTLPPVKTRQAKFIFGNGQDKVIHSESDDDTHDDNLDADYTIYEHAPLKSDMKLGTATQMFVDDCITQPEPTSIATYVDQEQHEASDKAKKAWISTMDKNIKKYKKIVAEMGEMVKNARSKYSRVPEIMERCCQWENALNVTQQPQAQNIKSVEDPNVDHEDNHQNVVSLAESTQLQKSDNEVGKKDGNISVGLENGHQLELADPLLGTVVRIEGDGQKLKASTESTLEISDTGLHKLQTVEKCRYAEHEIGQKLHTLADSALRDK